MSVLFALAIVLTHFQVIYFTGDMQYENYFYTVQQLRLSMLCLTK